MYKKLHSTTFWLSSRLSFFYRSQILTFQSSINFSQSTFRKIMKYVSCVNNSLKAFCCFFFLSFLLCTNGATSFCQTHERKTARELSFAGKEVSFQECPSFSFECLRSSTMIHRIWMVATPTLFSWTFLQMTWQSIFPCYLHDSFRILEKYFHQDIWGTKVFNWDKLFWSQTLACPGGTLDREHWIDKEDKSWSPSNVPVLNIILNSN